MLPSLNTTDATLTPPTTTRLAYSTRRQTTNGNCPGARLSPNTFCDSARSFFLKQLLGFASLSSFQPPVGSACQGPPQPSAGAAAARRARPRGRLRRRGRGGRREPGPRKRGRRRPQWGGPCMCQPRAPRRQPNSPKCSCGLSVPRRVRAVLYVRGHTRSRPSRLFTHCFYRALETTCKRTVLPLTPPRCLVNISTEQWRCHS